MVPAIKRLEVQWENEILYRKSYNKRLFYKSSQVGKITEGIYMRHIWDLNLPLYVQERFRQVEREGRHCRKSKDRAEEHETFLRSVVWVQILLEKQATRWGKIYRGFIEGWRGGSWRRQGEPGDQCRSHTCARKVGKGGWAGEAQDSVQGWEKLGQADEAAGSQGTGTSPPASLSLWWEAVQGSMASVLIGSPWSLCPTLAPAKSWKEIWVADVRWHCSQLQECPVVSLAGTYRM